MRKEKRKEKTSLVTFQLSGTSFKVLEFGRYVRLLDVYAQPIYGAGIQAEHGVRFNFDRSYTSTSVPLQWNFAAVGNVSSCNVIFFSGGYVQWVKHYSIPRVISTSVSFTVAGLITWQITLRFSL